MSDKQDIDQIITESWNKIVCACKGGSILNMRSGQGESIIKAACESLLTQPKQIPLTDGQFATVDHQDFVSLAGLTWHCTSAGRAATGKTNYMHRIIAAQMGIVGEVDHIDGNPLNNRRSNIRGATRTQNEANKPKREFLTSVYKGVHWSNSHQAFVAQIKQNGKVKYLGQFGEHEVDAALTYDFAAIQEFGEFANLNFPILRELCEKATEHLMIGLNASNQAMMKAMQYAQDVESRSSQPKPWTYQKPTMPSIGADRKEGDATCNWDSTLTRTSNPASKVQSLRLTGVTGAQLAWEEAQSDAGQASEQERLRKALKQASDDLICKDTGTHYCSNCDNSLYFVKANIEKALSHRPTPATDDTKRRALSILLDSRKCWTNDEPEIPEEISAQFDIPMHQARFIHDAAMRK